MEWEVFLVEEVEQWYLQLSSETAALVAAAIDALALAGPSLGRPLVDRIEGSRIHNLKELRPPSSGRSEMRILFVFDPARRAVLLVAGDKSKDWAAWYPRAITVAEQRYVQWLLDVSREEL